MEGGMTQHYFANRPGSVAPAFPLFTQRTGETAVFHLPPSRLVKTSVCLDRRWNA
ncbi:hypothetical protein B4113_2866 [Geobacillus sp. B4113_201601]|nr:hypothetical protein B4113_2866 [Geobacillus sp. B4113_201601]